MGVGLLPSPIAVGSASFCLGWGTVEGPQTCVTGCLKIRSVQSTGQLMLHLDLEVKVVVNHLSKQSLWLNTCKAALITHGVQES